MIVKGSISATDHCVTRNRSEIEEVTDGLENAISCLASNLDILYSRLNPVMLVMADEAMKGGSSPTPCRSPLGNQIENQAERVMTLVGMTNRLMAALVLP